MKNETLLDIAKRNLWAADLMLKYRGEDDGQLNLIAYHLQQFYELAIKHYLEHEGIKYPITHDITALLTNIDEDIFDEIEPWAGTITLMEAKTRYIKNYRVAEKTIAKVRALADVLLDKIRQADMKNTVNLDIDTEEEEEYER